jgi:hypothetical protein
VAYSARAQPSASSSTLYFSRRNSCWLRAAARARGGGGGGGAAARARRRRRRRRARARAAAAAAAAARAARVRGAHAIEVVIGRTSHHKCCSGAGWAGLTRGTPWEEL